MNQNALMMFILGVILGIGGAVILASIVIGASWLSWIGDNFLYRLLFSLVGLALIQFGYRLVTASRKQ